MAKRRTKAQKEAEGKAALKRRVLDIASGAQGYAFDGDGGDLLTPEDLSRVLPAVRQLWKLRPYSWPLELCNLGHWGDDIETLIDWLYDGAGLRADGSAPGHLTKEDEG